MYKLHLYLQKKCTLTVQSQEFSCYKSTYFLWHQQSYNSLHKWSIFILCICVQVETPQRIPACKRKFTNRKIAWQPCLIYLNPFFLFFSH